jgi:hypothetical protein
VEWEETTIADYRIFYHLSKAVEPIEIGLEILSP